MRIKNGVALLILFLFTASFSMSGCSPVLHGNTEVGDCTLNVAFLNVLTSGGPCTFMGIEEDIRDKVEIEVTLQNIVTERKYIVNLSKDNSYMYTAKLFPGTYRILDISSSMNEYTGMHVSASVEVLELTRGVPQNLSIAIDNEDEFALFQSNLLASDDIVMSSKFSRKIMIDGNMLDIQDVLSYLNMQSSEMVKPYAKSEIKNDDKGIEIIVLNDSSSSRNATECRVIGIHISKSTVLLPGGITLGMNADTICNKNIGIYGEPTGFEGIAMYGQGLGNLKAIYLDAESGDKIGLEIDSEQGFITGMTYELEVYE